MGWAARANPHAVMLRLAKATGATQARHDLRARRRFVRWAKSIRDAADLERRLSLVPDKETRDKIRHDVRPFLRFQVMLK